MNDLQHRHAMIIEHLRRNPGTLRPEDALQAVVWPSEDFAARFRAHRASGTCIGCDAPLDVRTTGCRTCLERHRSRQRRVT